MLLLPFGALPQNADLIQMNYNTIQTVTVKVNHAYHWTNIKAKITLHIL